MDHIAILRAEVKRLSEQSGTDFQFTMVALKDMGQRIEGLGREVNNMGQRVEAVGREVNEGFNQLAGRMRLQEQRVTAVLQAVDDALAVYQDHEERLQALERSRDSAA